MATLRVFYDKWVVSTITGDDEGSDSDDEKRLIDALGDPMHNMRVSRVLLHFS